MESSSLYYSKAKHKGLLSSIFLLLLIILPVSYGLSCDKVATLPKSFDILMPDYDRLPLVHISNNFFLESSKNPNDLTIHINLKEKSVMKIQVTPRHTYLQLKIKTPMNDYSYTSSAAKPVDFTILDPSQLFTGDVLLSFGDFVPEQDILNKELQESAMQDTTCNFPYMYLEIYFEKFEHFLNRTTAVAQGINNLKDFNHEYWTIFEELKTIEAKSKNKDLLVSKVKRDLTPFQLGIGNTVSFYDKYKINVINEYKIEVPDAQEKDTGDDTLHLVTKYFIKMQIYSDFLYGGGLHLLIIHSNAIDNLEELRCLNDGRCVLSERRSKNAMILETILTPGSYTLLLINLNMNVNDYRQHLKLTAIPITAAIKLKYIKKTENRFNCLGKRLPESLNSYLKANPNYFEYKGRISFNMQSLKDSTYITIPADDDYIIRVNTYFMDGNNIDIKLLEIGGQKSSAKNSQVDLGIGLPNTNSTTQVLIGQSSNWGGQSSFYFTLLKGKTYLIMFDYSGSFFTQYVRKTCEMYYLKMAISSKSNIKNNLPRSYSEKEQCLTSTEQLDAFLKKFEEQHSDESQYKFKEYEIISNEINSFNNLESTQDFRIIYTKSFTVNTPISFYIDIMNDFVSSSVIPVLIPVPMHSVSVDAEAYLKNQLKKLILHKGTMNMKMTPGKYQLVLLHGLNQVTTKNNKAGSYLELISLPRCASFKIKFNIIRLNTNKLLNWECHYQKFHHIPEAIALSNTKDKYFYFNHHMLIPLERDVITIKTTDQKFLLRLRAQFTQGESTDIMSISLKRANKTLAQAKPEVFEEGAQSSIVYLNFLLMSNTVYEIHFANKYKDMSDFYSKCRLFTLDLMLAKSTLNNEKCDRNIPTINQIKSERLIDQDEVDNAAQSKLTKNLYDAIFSDKTEPTSADANKETISSMFSFKFNANDTMTFDYPFEIWSNLARVTMMVETPYALPIEVSARMYREITLDKQKTNNLIATEDIEDENIYTLRGILLASGKYIVRFSVNKEMYNTVVKEALKDFCVQFKATLLIEKKSYDSIAKGASQKAENCPYIEFPQTLNLPGWIYSDTSYSLNSRYRFKIKNEHMSKTFTLTKKSLFKFYLFDDDSINIHSMISLSEERNNKSKVLVEKMTKEDTYVSKILPPGDYIIEFQFELVTNKQYFFDSSTDNYDNLCYFFDVYLTVQPLEDVIESNVQQCTTDISKFTTISPQAVETYFPLIYKDMENSKGSNTISTVRINPMNEGKGKIEIELIYNSYLSPIYGMYVYLIDPQSNKRADFERDVIYSDNFMWITFYTMKDWRYEIEFVSGSFQNFSQCTKSYISYNYFQVMDESATSLKTSCEITSRLPINLFKNTGGILVPYGGGQSKTNGEMYFYGKFLLPKSSMTLRTEFLIKEVSIVVIRLNPLYNLNQNNIFLEISKNSSSVSKFNHNDMTGLMIAELSNESFSSTTKNEGEGLLYSLDITFDRMLSKCESYELLFSIIPKQVYTNIYVNCDSAEEDKNEELPMSLGIASTSIFQYRSHIKQGFTKDANNNLMKIIDLTIDKTVVFEAKLRYIHSENLLDISISNDDKNYYSLGKESIDASHVNGIWIYKTISANLKPGKYKLKLLYHSVFTLSIKHIFSSTSDSFCFGFTLEISASVLDLNNKYPDAEDESNNDAEIRKITMHDLNKNTIVKVSPSSAVNLRLGNRLEIKVSLAMPSFQNKMDMNKYVDMISLHDNSLPTTSYSQGITPNYISDFKSDEISFVFELNQQHFTANQCYKLSYNNKFLMFFDDIVISKVDHLYCLMKCNCNAVSNFSCSLNGKCRCKAPFTGTQCEECMENYIKTNSGGCIHKNLSNLKCDDKTTCNENGYCYFPGEAFNPFDLNVKNLCKCNEGFDTLPGYPISSFCNTCKKRNKYYPFCYDKESNGDFNEKMSFTWSTHCSDFHRAPTLPKQLHLLNIEDHSLGDYGKVYKSDGSVNFSGIFKTNGDDDYTEIVIREESLIRVLFITQEYNRAQLVLMDSLHSDTVIASTEGDERTESLIAKLFQRQNPYVIKVNHAKLKSSCNRFQIKISIIPFRNVLNELTCSSGINNTNRLNYLPQPSYVLNGNDQINNDEKWFDIHDSLILSKDNFLSKAKVQDSTKINYAANGLLTTSLMDQVFEYNIGLNVMNPITFSSIVHYQFVTSDILLTLRHSNGTVIQNGNWMIPDVSQQDNDYFYSGVEHILDPGNYYLTISESISANHILQMLYGTETQKNKQHIDRCFKFMMNIQTNLINKPDKDLPTERYDAMYNRIISVEPSNLQNAKYNQKLNININFKDEIKSKPKKDESTSPSQHIGFTGAFFLMNQATNVKVSPSHVYLQSSFKQFQLIFDQYSLEKNSCYVLNYDLSIIESSKDKTQKIASDSPNTHRYCTKDCECNANAEYDCNGTKCECKAPYAGEQCKECIEGYFFIDNRCIPQVTCDDSICNGKGKCIIGASNSGPSCLCLTYFTGSNCNTCQDKDVQFPNCAAKYITSRHPDNKEKGAVIDVGTENISQSENECKYSFLPYDLDNLGFLHLDGNMHISGKYSIKNINGRKFSMSFTLKEESHLKLYLEHSKMTYSVTMFLVDQDNKLIVTSFPTVGPAGINTASVLDFIANKGKYAIVFYVKDLGSVESNMVINYSDAMNDKETIDECLTVFIEMQAMTLEREINVIKSFKEANPTCAQSKESNPQLIPSDLSMNDFMTKSQSNLIEGITASHVHIRNTRSDYNTIYFYYEYMYIPDYLDREIMLELSINSKFLNAEVGVVLEVVDIPNNIKANIKSMTTKALMEVFGTKISEPQCNVHCFSGVKKYNSEVISRILPSDTLFRIWFYDVSPSPMLLPNSAAYTSNTCIAYETSLQILNVETPKEKLSKQINASLCPSNELPSDLNNKDYLGDTKYIKKFGFHIVDTFRIDRATNNGSAHTTTFTLDKWHVMRLIVFPGRVDADLQLFAVETGKEDIALAKSTSKNFEDAIVIELPLGKYKIVFKFYTPPSGYNKCESMKMEFAMRSFTQINGSITKMKARHPENVVHSQINLLELLLSPSEIFNIDSLTNTYTFPIDKPFNINIDDVKKYEGSITIANITFVVEEKDDQKIELNALAASNFLFVDCSIYLSYTPSKGQSTMISAAHRKNLNTLITGKLRSGTYILSLRYYRRLHYIPLNAANFRDESLESYSFGEVQFNAQFINTSKDTITMLTSKGYIKVQPDNNKGFSHTYKCRNSGLPVPKSFNSLRYLLFSPEMHILDTFILPPMGQGENEIKFEITQVVSAMIRIYVESHDADIDIELREEKENGEYLLLTKSSETVHFETIMQLIKEGKKYSILLKYKGFSNAGVNNQNPCRTFKMEIAIEKNHNYACPISSKYSMLNDLKPIPEVLPVKYSTGGSIYTYNSKTIFKGEDKNSGYVYMLRSEKDTSIEFATFTVTQPLDLRFEVVNDFLQAPITIMLASNSQVQLDESQSISKLFQESFNKLGPKNFIISYGQIYESRTTLLVKNLPKGKYSLYLYLPGLKTVFVHERVCSIYDISIEAKKSRNHFRAKEIINTSNIKEDNLDLPIRLPSTFNSIRFMSGYGPYTYINYLSTYYLRLNRTESQKEDNKPTIINSIPFTLVKESLVELLISHNLIFKRFRVAIDSQTSLGTTAIKVLQPGQYTAVIQLIDDTPKDSPSYNNITSLLSDSLFTMFNLFVGISPVNRVKEIYTYNGLLSSYRQCTSMKFPDKMTFNKEKGEYRYMNDFMTFKKDDLPKDGVLTFTTLELKNSNRNRFIAELGTDFVLNMISIRVVHRQTKYDMKFENNRGMLDLTLPRGSYTVALVLTQPILLNDYTCLIFSINMRAIEIDNLPHGQSINQLLSVNEKDKTELLKPKCKGGIIPLEIFPNSDIKSQSISNDGTYIMHIPNTVYLTNRQKSLTQKNMNEIDINVAVDSLLRVTTQVSNPEVFNIVPRIRFQAKDNTTTDYYKNQRGGIVSKSLREKNSYWFLQKNTHESNEYYILELGLENDEGSYAMQSMQSCPKYNFDILIYNITKLATRFNCTLKDGKIYQMKKPQTVIPTISNMGYHESLNTSYFTEREYGEFRVQTEYYTGLGYKIQFNLSSEKEKETNYYVNARLGYPHSVSLFDMYLFKEDVLISYSTLLFSKNSTFTYQRHLQATLKVGNYSLVIMEYQWHNITQLIKSKSQVTHPQNLYLCLPFTYSLDITPITDTGYSPKVVSVSPPGPVIVKVRGEDLALVIKLTTAPFTQIKEPITMAYNYINMLNAFSLVKRTKDGLVNKKIKIHPNSAQASVNSKEWTLFFISKQFEGGVDYDFIFEPNWLHDSQGNRFSSVYQPIVIQSESSREAMIDTSNGNVNSMKTALESSTLMEEKKSDAPQAVEGNEKCSNHGVYIYDNILRKYLCTCFDGYSGKFCDYCEGKVIDGKCVYEEEVDEIPTHEIASAQLKDYLFSNSDSSSSSSKTSTSSSTSASSNDKSGKDCGNCFNGICDYAIGRCICDQGYYGIHCDMKKIEGQGYQKDTTKSNGLITRLKAYIESYITAYITFGKIFFVILIIIAVFYIYKYSHTTRVEEYKALNQFDKKYMPSDEYSINPSEPKKSDDPDSENANLVDYEISTEAKSLKK